MKSAVIATLFAASALAAPHTAARRAAHAARANRKSNLRLPAPQVNDGKKHLEFSTNWSGAVLSDKVGSFTYVTGTIVVPTPKSGGSAASSAAWVGIDGDTCKTAILQTGVDISVNADGSPSYDAWYEWYPDFAHDFTNFTVSSGNEVRMTVNATTTGTGIALLENLTTGGSVTHTFTKQNSPLCEQDAEWIVEDYAEGGGLVPFANFDAVVFTDAETIKDGECIGPTGANIFNIQEADGEILTDCEVTDASTVTCTYV
ncbi:peptidase A4 family-domain-containing protein [Xylaria nigripes]|nr:peptidase A4 family-domain-containing protein [Xylaria nigripes]